MNYDISTWEDGFQTTLSSDPTTLPKVTMKGFMVSADGLYKLVTAKGTTLTNVYLAKGQHYSGRIKAAYGAGSPVLTGYV